jgi:hypothetical protein
MAMASDGWIIAECGDAAHAKALAASLGMCGFRLHVGNLDDLRKEHAAGGVLIGFTTSSESLLLQKIDQWCASNIKGWLRCAVAPGEGFADAGPHFQPEDAGRLADFNRAYLPHLQVDHHPDCSAQDLAFWIQLIARPLGEICLNARTGHPANWLVRLGTGNFQSRTILPVLLTAEEESSAAAPFLLFEATSAYVSPVANSPALRALSRAE